MKELSPKVLIIVTLIIGASILGYGYMDYRYKKETLEQKVKSEEQAKRDKLKEEEDKEILATQRQEQLQKCLDQADENYDANWVSACLEINGNPYNLNDFVTQVGTDGKTYYVNKQTKIMYSEDFVWKMIPPLVPPGTSEFKANTEISKDCKLPITRIDRIDEVLKKQKDECFKKYPQK